MCDVKPSCAVKCVVKCGVRCVVKCMEKRVAKRGVMCEVVNGGVTVGAEAAPEVGLGPALETSAVTSQALPPASSP